MEKDQTIDSEWPFTTNPDQLIRVREAGTRGGRLAVSEGLDTSSRQEETGTDSESNSPITE